MAAIPLVTPLEGEPMRFLVRSRTEPGLRYLVDLESYNLNGECGCDHFGYHIRPELEGNHRPEPKDRTRCWHIMQARRCLLDLFLEKLAAQTNVQKQARVYRLNPERQFSPTARHA